MIPPPIKNVSLIYFYDQFYVDDLISHEVMLALNIDKIDGSYPECNLGMDIIHNREHKIRIGESMITVSGVYMFTFSSMTMSTPFSIIYKKNGDINIKIVDLKLLR